MYSITCDSLPLLIPSMLETYYAFSPTLTQKVNLPDELSFAISPIHPRYGSINRLTSRIKVYQGGTLISILRPLDSTMNMIRCEKWVCEGVLAWLKDAIVRPFTIQDSPANALAYFLNAYNSQVNADQQITLGTVTVTDPNDYIYRSSEEYLTVYDAIKTRLIDSLGGYLIITFDANEKPILNWYATVPDTSTQHIEFGENLAGFNRTVYGGETYTACIPLGAKNDDNTRLTIADVNNGLDYIVNNSLVGTFGYIYAPAKLTTWDDVTVAANLKSKAELWLTTIGASVKERIDIRAVDLHNADASIEAFRFLDNVIVSSAPHGLSATYVLTEIEIPLDDPSSTLITLGGERISLISELAKAQANAENQIGEIIADYVTGEQVASIAETTIENSTYIIQQAESIVAQALQEYVTTNDYETLRNYIDTQLEIIAGQVSFNFTSTTEDISTLGDNTQESFNTIYSFIRFLGEIQESGVVTQEAGIVLGKSTDDVKVKLQNSVMYFFEGDEKIVTPQNAFAWFSYGKLYVKDAQLTNSLTIGDDSNNMAFKIVGSGSLKCLFLSPKSE